jgi:hypothetical protein
MLVWGRRDVVRAAALGAVAALLAAPTGAANAVTEAPYLVTYVARTCATYTDVMANLARNNLQESLRDLGPDTVYVPGQAITPSVEETAPPIGRDCHPLVGWGFALGQSIASKSPSTLQLSTVTSPYSTSIVTQSSTSWLDAAGNPTGQQLEGAVTIALTDAQVRRAQSGQSLWTQGGTPSQPLNGLQSEYGFAALRCAVDNVNGDNVEWIGFPGAARHVFCYYYAVQPPPEAGTIVVRKELASGAPANAFLFHGNISYGDTTGDNENDFVLSPTPGAPASQTFIRGAVTGDEDPWTFEEIAQPGWTLVGGEPTCSATGGSTIDVTGAAVSVVLEAGDVVTCTYVNDLERTGFLSLGKVTEGGVGSFPFEVDVPSPGNDVFATATTTQPGTQVDVASGFGYAGTYTATETLPAPTVRGTWAATSAVCNGAEVPLTISGLTASASRTVSADDTAVCAFVNTFTPGGALIIDKTSISGVGDFGFEVYEVDEATQTVTTYSADATTLEPGVPVTAVGPGLDELVVGDPDRYLVLREFLPPGVSGFDWIMDSFSCDDNLSRADLGGGFVVVRLTDENPVVRCSVTNRLVAVSPSLPNTGARLDGAPFALAAGFVLVGAVALAMRRGRRTSQG